MPDITITNLTSQRVFVNDMYLDIPPGASRNAYRTSSDLMMATRLQELVADGILDLAIAYTADELSSSFNIFPGVGGVGGLNAVQFGKGLANDTIAKALTAAAALSPGPTNRVSLVGLDSGIYAESFTLPQWVSMFAPEIKVEGNIILEDDVTCQIGEVEAASGILVQKPIGAAGASYFQANVVRATGAAIGAFSFSLGTGAVLMYEVRSTYVEDGQGVGDVSTATGHIHLMCEDIYITGTGVGLSRSGGSTTVGYVAHIVEIGGGVGNGTAISCASGEMNLVVNTISANVATNILGGATVRLTCPDKTGSSAGPGTLVQAQYA